MVKDFYSHTEVQNLIATMLTSNVEWQNFDDVELVEDKMYWAKVSSGEIMVVAYKTTSHCAGWAFFGMQISDKGHPEWVWNGMTFTFALDSETKLTDFPFKND